MNPENASAAPNPSKTEVAFPGATQASDIPFTSNAPSPTATIVPEASTAGAARALETGAMGLGALFGAAALIMA